MQAYTHRKTTPWYSLLSDVDSHLMSTLPVFMKPGIDRCIPFWPMYFRLFQSNALNTPPPLYTISLFNTHFKIIPSSSQVLQLVSSFKVFSKKKKKSRRIQLPIPPTAKIALPLLTTQILQRNTLRLS